MREKLSEANANEKYLYGRVMELEKRSQKLEKKVKKLKKKKKRAEGRGCHVARSNSSPTYC